MDMNINYFLNELRKSEYYDVIQKLPKECFYNIPNGTIQATIDNTNIYFIREYFEIQDIGRKVIFNYRDNDILKQIDFYDWGLNSNDVFYEERIKIILQSLIEE